MMVINYNNLILIIKLKKNNKFNKKKILSMKKKMMRMKMIMMMKMKVQIKKEDFLISFILSITIMKKKIIVILKKLN